MVENKNRQPDHEPKSNPVLDEDHLIAERMRKLNELRQAGINPFPYTYNQTHHSEELLQKYAHLKPEDHTKDTVSVAGRIMTLRRMGKVTFLHLQDQQGKIQLYLREDDIGKDPYHVLKNLDMGDVIGAKGMIFKTKTGEVTVAVETFQLLAKSTHPLPEKFHGLKDTEIRYRQRYLDLIMNPESKKVFETRAKILKSLRSFLDKKGFMEVQTPILQPQYGGANARPFTTKINAWNMPMYLRIAYELHLKRLIVGGFEKIYDLSSCFRNEGSDKTHNPEFGMIEIQWAYADYNDVMTLTEQAFEYIAKEVLGTTKIKYKEHSIDVKAPWKRMTIKEALKKFADIDVDKYSDEELFDLRTTYNLDIKGDLNRGVIIAALFEELCEDKLIQPTHIIDHPQEISPLAKPHRKNPGVVERVEPFIVGWEFGNGYSELTDPVLQRKLLEEQAEKGRGGNEEAHPMDDDYIHALEYGLPPNAGMGLGIDRMVMLFTNSESIRDVILFPTMKPEKLSEPQKVKETMISVALINTQMKLEPWQQMNTIAHLTAAFGARQGRELFYKDTIKTLDGHEIKLNTTHAIMIKEIDSNKACIELLKKARELGFEVAEFTKEMIETSDDEKIEAITKQKKLSEVEYMGILIYGKKKSVQDLTKRFKLFQ